MNQLLLKKIVFVMVFCCSLLGQLFAVSELQVSAEKAYAEKNYKSAISFYTQMIDKEGISYKLYYNLGNAYYKDKQLGLAIYNYELANKIQPNQQDILNNLSIANSKIVDQIEGKNNYFINAVKTGLVHALSLNTWAWLCILSFGSSLLLFFIFFSSSLKLAKQISFFSSVLFLLLSLISFILGGSSKNEKTNINFAVILKPEVKAYNEPTTTAINKFTLHEGTKVRVIDFTDNYVNIKLDNGNEAWLTKGDVGLL